MLQLIYFVMIFTVWSSSTDAAILKPKGAGGDKTDGECRTCEFLIEILHTLWGTDILQDCIEDAIIYICVHLHIESNFVCSRIVGPFKGEVLYVVQQLIIEPKQICHLLITNCGVPFLDPNKAKWHLPMPGIKPPFAPVRQPVANSPTKKMLHISDTHVDMDYVVGTEANCHEPLCCRRANDTGDKSGKSVQNPAGFWGSLAKCDAPYWTLINMLQHILQTHTDLDYIILTGDYESHADWNYAYSSHEDLIRNLTQTMKTMFPNLPIYFCLGNHEGVPVDSWLQLNETDPDGTMSWFIQQLYAAEQAGDKVYVIGHIPGGIEGWAINYINTINRFENTVVGQFFGHTHNEEFSMIYENPNDPTSRATGVLQIGGSVTTYSYLNPCYRIYTLDGDYHGSTFQILDIDTYFLNLTKANANPSNPTWEHLTNAKRDFGMNSLLPKDYSQFIDRMDTNDSLFARWLLNYYRVSGIQCDASCRQGHLCSLQQTHNNATLCAGLQKSDNPLVKNNQWKTHGLGKITVESVKAELKQMKIGNRNNDKCPI